MLLLFISQVATASTYYLSDVGIRGFSRAGAFVAGADDISAQWYNPAALTRINGGHVQVYGAGVKQFISFDRKDYPGEGPNDENGDPTDLITPPVVNEAPIIAIPHMGVAYDFGVKDLTVMLGFTSPYATDIQYQEGGPQRYSMENSTVLHTYTGPSIAYRFADFVSVGVGTSWNYLLINQQRKVALQTSLGCPAEQEDPACDIDFEANAEDTGSLAWNVGLLLEPPSGKWALGFMWQPQITFDALGSLRANFANNKFHSGDFQVIVSEEAIDDDVNIAVVMPNILKAGLLFRPSPALEIELASVYERWSEVDSMTISNVDMQFEVSELMGGTAELTDDIVIPTGFSDAVSVRLGWQWKANEQFTLRNGLLYETTGMPAQLMNVGSVDRNKIGYGFGGSWNPTSSWSLDVGVFQSFFGTVNVEDSESEQIAIEVDIATQSTTVCGPNTECNGRVVGDGVYSSHALIAGMGLTWRFGQ